MPDIDMVYRMLDEKTAEIDRLRQAIAQAYLLLKEPSMNGSNEARALDVLEKARRGGHRDR